MSRTECLSVLMAMAFIGMGFCDSTLAQELVSTRGKVRVFKGGLIVQGRDLAVNDESVSLTMGRQTTFLDLKDIDRVDVRRGKAMKGACIGGGGCLALGFMVCTLVSAEDFRSEGASRGQCYAGSMIWSALFSGLGALIGNTASSWETIYYRTKAGLEVDDGVGLAELSSPDRAQISVAILPQDCCGATVGFSIRF